ncbi:MAG: anti-ECFsigma factor, ChrR, partial [Caulobacteraceae bacterium]|nr:anti-ECFsigma factor, ChrR [Caulobacteraceae bacterium]
GIALPAALGRRGLGARRWLGPGLWVAPVRSNRPDGWRTYLLRAPPRLKLPRHGHNGPEFAAVLQGAFRDETGLYRPGDFAESGEELEHHPRVEDDGPCVCLVSGHGGMRATGIWRLIQPLIGV